MTRYQVVPVVNNRGRRMFGVRQQDGAGRAWWTHVRGGGMSSERLTKDSPCSDALLFTTAEGAKSYIEACKFNSDADYWEAPHAD